MNVFEDLVIELQRENLLETTVIDEVETRYTDFDQGVMTEVPIKEFTFRMPPGYGEPASKSNAILDGRSESAPENAPTDLPVETAAKAPSGAKRKRSRSKKQKKNRESLEKRPVSEVSCLQMVEHVLTGIEREYLKIVPNSFDDFNVKKALHAFLSLGDRAKSDEYAAAEFALMQETEAWCTALGERDSKIPVSSLRQYCENSRPALSSQALVGLARFYRNSPCSEHVRAKFDFTITRLFSRPGDGDQRVCLFSRDEMIDHLNTFYREWSSVPLYTADDDESRVLLTALSFEDLAVEAENASTFDHLIASDFFGRLRLFKESISELFFAPIVTSAAVYANIRIGNCFVNLIERERDKMNDASIRSKYGDLNDQAISDAASRTLKLVELLRVRPLVENEDGGTQKKKVSRKNESKTQTSKSKAKRSKDRVIENERHWAVELMFRQALGMNKWILGVAIAVLAVSIGLYIWPNYLAGEQASITRVGVVNIDDSILKEHINTARMSGDTLYGLLEPTWDTLSRDKRHQFMQRVLQAGKDRGYTKVQLIAKDGKPAGYASGTRIDVIMR